MKKTITVLGNFSGRNAGDAAILGTLMRDVTALYPGVQFKVPTINTKFVRRAYPGYDVQPVGLMPWNLSVKIFGWPTFRAVRSADVVLVTDAIMFDRRLYNPLFNYLWTLSLVLPMARRKGIPVVLYNVSLGPIFTEAGAECLRKVIRSADVVALRDRESFAVLEQIELSPENVVTAADCAIGTDPAPTERVDEIATKEGLFRSGRPTVGFNINSYLDTYVRDKRERGVQRQKFVRDFAATVDRAIEEFEADVVVVETQPMDLGIANELLAAIRHRDRVKMISNRTYYYDELAGLMSRMELFVGMRTHSLILAASVRTPVVGIVTYPKNRGFMRSIGLEDYLIEFKDFSAEAFFGLVERGWRNRTSVRKHLENVVPRERAKARATAELLRPFLTA